MQFMFSIFVLCFCIRKCGFSNAGFKATYQQAENVKATSNGTAKFANETLVTEGPVIHSQSIAFKKWLNDVLENYDSRLRPYFGYKTLLIKLGMQLISISKISENDMSFTLEMFFHESWTDPRLTFDPQLFNNASQLTLPLDAPNWLWIPDTTFLNALHALSPKVGSVSHLYYMKLYSNGTLSYSRRLSVTLECAMDLTMYPFDQQACRAEISSYGWTVKDVIYEWRLNNDSIPIDKISLADFYGIRHVTRVLTRTYVAGDFSVPLLCVELGRRYGFCFLQLIVPATAVVTSTWISLWLESETKFSDLVAVILAIIFLSYSYNTVMPKVNYIKAMDIYLVACFLFTFLSLVKLAIVKYLQQRVAKRKEQQKQRELAAVTATNMIICDETEMDEMSKMMESGAEKTATPEESGTAGRPASKKNGDWVSGPRQGTKPVLVRRRRMTLIPRRASAPQFDYVHDKYWRYMKAFHVTSQLVLPLAFLAFCLFYFFIYPYLHQGGVCE